MWILVFLTFISIKDSLIAVIAKSYLLLIATYVDNQFVAIPRQVTFQFFLVPGATTEKKKIDLQADDWVSDVFLR